MRKKIVVVMLLITFGFLLSSCELLDMFIKKYNVGFYSDEVLVKEETVKENELISPPTLNNKEGYDFLGWYKDLNDESTKWDFKNDKVNENLKLNALWELKINYLELTNLKLEEDMLIWDNIDEATYIVTINDNNLTLTVNEFPLNEYQEYLKEAKTIKVEPVKQDFTGIVSEITVKYNMTNVYEGYKLEFDEFDFPGFELSRSSYNTTTIDYEDHYFNVSEARLTSKDEEPKVGTVALILRTNGALELKEGYENFYSLEFNLGNYQKRASTSLVNLSVSNNPSEGYLLVNSYNNSTTEDFIKVSIFKEDIKELVNLNEPLYFKLEAEIKGANVNIVLDDLIIKEEMLAHFEELVKGEAVELGTYYKSAEGLKGKELVDELRVIVSTNLKKVKYSDYKVIGEFADKKLDNKDFVRGIYDLKDLKANWGSKSEWHREHVWPNSRLGMERVKESDVNQGSDPHNLRAIYPSTNSSRSNRYYSNPSSIVNSWTTLSDGMFYPGDEDKGDVARILLYMVVRYEFLGLTDNVELLSNKAYTIDAAYMGKLSVLLAWHNEDPVDDYELARNEVIYGYQNNRNPFIDHPELFSEVYLYLETVEDNRTVKVSLYFEFEVNYSELINKEKWLN